MITTTEVAAALNGAWRLAQLDRRGMTLFEATPEGFWKSFVAAAIVLPGHAIFNFLEDKTIAAPLWREIAVWLIAYVIGWVTFPLAMTGICDLIDRRARYVGYIVAANWCSVLQTALLIPLAVLSAYGGWAATLLYVIAFFAMLAYDWYVARVALEIDGFTAAGVVFLSVLIWQLIARVSDALLIRA
ncbi:MAG: hypothetical protein EXQ88_02810 [Alphaproteobacteria bacterium]|nr:hypothetical protein [Alphaproteobacteria bacterium]